MAKKPPPPPPYEVGYGKPPKHTQFKPGRSGNPNGRRKGVNNLQTDVLRVLREPVKMRSGDKVRTISTQEATIRKLREKALGGDARSLDRLVDLATRHNNQPLEQGPVAGSDPDEAAVFEGFVARLKAAALRDISSTDPAAMSSDGAEREEADA